MHKNSVHIISMLILSTYTLLCLCSMEIPYCESGFKGCCGNYKWNTETQQCEKCLPGYSGTNCSQPCPYPFYGDWCQGKCDCDNNTCDVSVGCLIHTTC
ncbi:protein draper-like [Saccostrea cucullata]|uniref:protein draper-like n=1 Tax=Saccostrea cuccullata TaxID=36930 RepID=UPI002ED5A94C